MSAYMGVDASLTGTGVAITSEDGFVFSTTLAPPKGHTGVVRLAWLRDQLLDIALTYQPTKICVEGYAFSRMQSQAHKIGEWGGTLRLALWEAGFDVWSLSPSALKKVATGKGNTKGKGPVAMALYKLTGVDLSHADDEADAAWLAIAVQQAERPVYRLTKPQTDGLKSLTRETPERMVQARPRNRNRK